ncbi:MAG: hypothetical protein NC120_08630 [Ruminococcus sp.]|nr:hypothetical protein [Ruminococcus sp.]
MIKYSYIDRNLILRQNLYSDMNVINFSNESDARYLNVDFIKLQSETAEQEYMIYYLSYNGLKPTLILNRNILLVGVDFGVALLGNDLKIFNKVTSDYLFCNAFFYNEKILIVFECEILIYDLSVNCVIKSFILNDIINDFIIKDQYLFYNTIENHNYSKMLI